MSAYSHFGSFFKEKRKEQGFTLRKFCEIHKLDPGNLSKLERGLMPPPQNRDILEKYAGYLNIKPDSDDWYTFFDLAASCTGKIPEDVMSDEELVKKLPLIFRTLRGQKVPKEKLHELAELIRKT